MKLTYVIEIKTPTKLQMFSLFSILFPEHDKEILYQHIEHDLKKLNVLFNIFKTDMSNLSQHYKILKLSHHPNRKSEDVKGVVSNLIKSPTQFHQHKELISDPDRTIIGLLYHENVIDVVTNLQLYEKMLQNFCFSDYYDRLIFQKQIWQVNELSSLIKTFYNNFLLHQTGCGGADINDVRFTKVLTKYSTEFNNSTFINEMTQQLLLDKKDMFLYFGKLKRGHLSADSDLQLLDIQRMQRFLERYSSELKGLVE